MLHAIDELQGDVEGIAACEMLQWPDVGRPFYTFTHPMPSEVTKPFKSTPSRVQDLNSVWSILVTNSKY